MRIYVDADACPVVRQTEEVARKYGIAVTLLCDTNHVLRSDYSEVKVIGAGSDAVDFALVNLCRAGDIVVTQDYGVAAMALSKRAYAIHQNGCRTGTGGYGDMTPFCSMRFIRLVSTWKGFHEHDPRASVLTGELTGDEKITIHEG